MKREKQNDEKSIQPRVQAFPLLPKHVWTIHARLLLAGDLLGLALLDGDVDSGLRGGDLVYLGLAHVCSAGQII
ncbi:MAG: hypothetical protein GJ678_01390 [Rhodobacteraceae bacterium]|nr:hypothetical protein [Paracoccaceae bacterium]